MLTYSDVFVPGGFPEYTYNPRASLMLEERLRDAIDHLPKLTVVTGHTKSGKTVLVRKILPREDSIWIDGGSISEENDFWAAIIAQLELFQTTMTSSIDETSKSAGAEIGAEGNILVAKAHGKVTGSFTKKMGSSIVSSRSLPSKIAALNGLRESKLPLVVDDFHYIPRAIQGVLVKALKPLIFDGHSIVTIAIPHRRYDSVKVEREMTGRISPILIPVWTEDELKYIPKAGFRLLNHSLAPAIVSRISAEAIGSPHLMQDFCRSICRAKSIIYVGSKKSISLSDKKLEGILREVAESIGKPIFDKLARGPRQRTDRLQRTLKNGKQVDIYQLVLYALAHIRPDLITLEYEQLRTSIREVSQDAIPQLHEVARVLKHMATIASSDQSSTPVIDFEESDKKLHITDPFFAFYLRWGELSS